MKLLELPQAVLDDLADEEKWRLDIEPSMESKHEFYLSWDTFVVLKQSPYYTKTEEDLAEFVHWEGYDILLPVARSHHPSLQLIRLIPSADEQSLTIFLQDYYYEEYFVDGMASRYGVLAVADRYQEHGCDFYIASYYHFSYLIGAEYERSQTLWEQKRSHS